MRLIAALCMALARPDGDPLACRLSRPHGILVASDGVAYIGDSGSHRIRVLR
jgi:NHL repeat